MYVDAFYDTWISLNSLYDWVTYWIKQSKSPFCLLPRDSEQWAGESTLTRESQFAPACNKYCGDCDQRQSFFILFVTENPLLQTTVDETMVMIN